MILYSSAICYIFHLHIIERRWYNTSVLVLLLLSGNKSNNTDNVENVKRTTKTTATISISTSNCYIVPILF